MRLLPMILMLIAAAGCSRGDLAGASVAASGDASVTATSAPLNNEAQALGVLAALDQSEATLARQALSRPLDPTAAQFARSMLHEHEQALSQTHARAPAESDLAQAVLARGEATMASVQLEEDPHAYRHAFLATAAADYADALAIVDQALLPVAQTPAARAYLTDARRRLAARQQLALATVNRDT